MNDNNRRQLVPQSAAPLPLPWPVGPWPLPYMKKCSAGGPLPFQIILLLLSVGLVYAIWSLLRNLFFIGLACYILAKMGYGVANSNSVKGMGMFLLSSYSIVVHSVIIRCQEEGYTFLFSYPSFNEYIFNIVAPMYSIARYSIYLRSQYIRNMVQMEQSAPQHKRKQNLILPRPPTKVTVKYMNKYIILKTFSCLFH